MLTFPAHVFLYHFQGCRGLEHIPACTGWEAGHNMDWSQIYKWAKAHRHPHTFTLTSTPTDNLESPFLPSHLLCLLSSKCQQIQPRARLQQGALAESNTASPHRVHHLATTFAQIPQTYPHVPSLTAPPTERTKTHESCSYLHISKHVLLVVISKTCVKLNAYH